MGETKKFRSEEARRNYEKAERQRRQAIKCKAFDAKMTKKRAEAKAWLKKNPKKAILAAVCALAVIVLVCLGCKAAFNPLKGRQENWLITDVSSSSKDPAYRHLADFDLPQGYTRGDYSLYQDDVQQDFYLTANDASAVVQDVYITGAKGVVASEYPAQVLAYGIHKEAGEPKLLTIGGQECSAVYMVSDESEWDGEGMCIAHMAFYFDTPYNASISATFRSATMPYEQLPDEATLQAAAEKILAGLKIAE